MGSTENKSERSDRLELIRLVIELNQEAVAVRDNFGNLPIHRACGSISRFDVGSLQMLLRANRGALEVSNNEGELPVHLACREIWRGGPLILQATRFLIDEYPQALEASNIYGETPVIAALRCAWFTRSNPQRESGSFPPPDHLHFLLEAVRRGGPRSVWGSHRDIATGHDAFDTALEASFECCPDATLVSVLLEVWPFALCVCLTRPRADLLRGYDFVPAIAKETRGTLLALIEALLHDTSEGVVPRLIREHLRQAVGRLLLPNQDLESKGGFEVARLIQERARGEVFQRLRSDVLNFEALQDLLRFDHALQEMVTAMYRMNRAGRLLAHEANKDGAPETSEGHARILVAAGDNLSCVFLHLRDCCPALVTCREG
jgi:hypothetical protein